MEIAKKELVSLVTEELKKLHEEEKLDGPKIMKSGEGYYVGYTIFNEETGKWELYEEMSQFYPTEEEAVEAFQRMKEIGIEEAIRDYLPVSSSHKKMTKAIKDLEKEEPEKKEIPSPIEYEKEKEVPKSVEMGISDKDWIKIVNTVKNKGIKKLAMVSDPIKREKIRLALKKIFQSV
jgi:hypothetical protein